MEYTAAQKIEQEIQNWISKNKTAKDLWAKISAKTATARDCKEYADALGNRYAEAIAKYYDAAEIADNLPEIQEVLNAMNRRSAYYSQQFAANLNDKAGINIQPQIVVNNDRVVELAKRIDQGAILNDGGIDSEDQFLLKRNVLENMAESASTDTLKENAELQEEAGYTVKIIRHLGSSGCCAYCEEMAGEYTLEEAEAVGAWAVHDNCDCWIEYRSDRAHHKITYGKGRSKITSDM